MVKWNWPKPRIIFPRENEHLVINLLYLTCVSFFLLSLLPIFFGKTNQMCTEQAKRIIIMQLKTLQCGKQLKTVFQHLHPCILSA